MDGCKFPKFTFEYLTIWVEIMSQADGGCEDLHGLIKQIADEINKERGTTGAVFYSDIINYVTRHQDRFKEYAEIVRYCLESLKGGSFQI